MKKESKFGTLIEQMEQAKAKMVAEGKKIFMEEVKHLFTQFPEMESFSWPQYTPYFNDGDECVFGVNSDEPKINGTSEINEAWTYKSYGNQGPTHYPSNNPELIPAQKAVAELLGAAPQDMMKDLFGNHVEITINRDGEIETEDYDHD